MGMRSSWFKEDTEEGEEKGKIEAICIYLDVNFGKDSIQLQEKVRHLDKLILLNRLLKEIFKTKSLVEVKAAVEQVLHDQEQQIMHKQIQDSNLEELVASIYRRSMDGDEGSQVIEELEKEEPETWNKLKARLVMMYESARGEGEYFAQIETLKVWIYRFLENRFGRSSGDLWRKIKQVHNLTLLHDMSEKLFFAQDLNEAGVVINNVFERWTHKRESLRLHHQSERVLDTLSRKGRKQGIKEGKMEVLQTNICDYLQLQFGDNSTNLQQQIMQINDPELLTNALEPLFSADKLSEFQLAMTNLSRKTKEESN